MLLLTTLSWTYKFERAFDRWEIFFCFTMNDFLYRKVLSDFLNLLKHNARVKVLVLENGWLHVGKYSFGRIERIKIIS